MDDLWAEASRDIEREASDLVYHRANAALEPLWPFLAVAVSQPELEHRKALAMNSLQLVANQSGMALVDLGELIDRRHALVAEANEITASLHKQAEEEEGGQWVVVDKSTGAKVAGPFSDREKAQEAIDENDSGLPSSELVIEHESAEPEEEEGEGKEASRRHALQEGENILAETVPQIGGTGLPEKPPEHDEEADDSIPPQARTPNVTARKTAAEEQPNAPQVPPQQGETAGTPPEGPDAPGEMSGPPAATSFPETTKPRQIPGGGSGDPMQDSVGDQSDAMGDASGGDPVGDQVDQVTATVRQHNPSLDEVTCRRVARRVVSKYLTATGEDGINYVGPISKDKPEEEDPAHSGETAAAGMAGRSLIKELPLLEI